MKKIILLMIFLLSIASVSALVGHVYPDSMKSGETTNMIVTFFNYGSSSVKDLQVRGYFPDFDVRTTSDDVTVKGGKSARAYLVADVPGNVAEGFYPVIVSSQNEDGVRKKTHSWVYIYK
ncbi:MAG: hypothetical protein AABW92_02235 [Nanoarchaeota archaeon]